MSKIYMIGNAHLDPVWLWQWQEGFAEIKATFKSALDRMKEFEDYKFTSACGAYYMWIEQSDPEMFAEIQARVKEGRWCLAGGWLIQADCNLPCGESFARHALVTQRYFLEKFGKMAITGYNVDSFGHNGNLPMILKNSRMENYVFMRPMPEEKKLPQSLFVWESADGSRVTTYRVPFRYCITPWRYELFEQIAELNEGTDQMAFYGIGNHGGGATVELLNRKKETLDERYIYSTPDKFFEDQKDVKLPIVRDDLQFHAKGCYSAFGEIKQLNRKAENALLSTEKLLVLSNTLVGTSYPQGDLKQAWKNVLFDQFHDILGGCSIREAYDDARLSEGEALAIASRKSNFAMQQISWKIDTVGDFDAGTCIYEKDAQKIGKPLVIFNPLDHEVKKPVHVRRVFGSVKDADGNLIPCQTVRASKTDREFKWARSFEATVPAFGYSVYRFFDSEDSNDFENPFTITENSIANGKIKITFDKASGELSSIYDIASGKELLSKASSIALLDDSEYDTWAHKITHFDKKLDADISAKISITEKGPVCATIRVEQKVNDSIIIRDYTLSADSDEIKVKTKIDFREKFGILKFTYPASLNEGRCFCKIPFGSIERPTDGSEQPCGEWICLKDNDGGLGIATDSKYSFDANKNALSLTVLRNCLFADHFAQATRDEFNEFTEMGISRFEYVIFPFTTFGNAERRAQELNNPLTVVYETFHKGPLPLSYEGVKVSADNVSITAIKAHEDGNGIIIRCYETDGKDTDFDLQLFERKFELNIPHNSVKTYLIENGEISETDFIEF